MTEEIDLGGTIYISSKRAAEITGYTQDYVGQLARSGAIIGKRVSGLWYIQEDSLKQHKEKADQFKPEPPRYVSPHDAESSVSFDGKDYVSAARASKITGYAQDYVGQLARSGKIVSRQIGNRWFVDREALVEHKKHNDALLAAVQADSVGLAKESEPISIKEVSDDLHFKYIQDEIRDEDLLPKLPEKSAEIEENKVDLGSSDLTDEINDIPIRVIRAPKENAQEYFAEHTKDKKIRPKMPKILKKLGIGAAIGILVVAGIVFLVKTPFLGRGSTVIKITSMVDINTYIPRAILDVLSKKIHYSRDSN